MLAVLLVSACASNVSPPPAVVATPTAAVSGVQSPVPTRDVKFCLASAQGAAQYYSIANPLGINDCVAVYYTAGSANALPYGKFNPATKKIVVVKFPVEDGVLAKIKNGGFDDAFRAFGQGVKDLDQDITVRLCNEFNGDWYSCGVYYPGNNPDDFIAVWRRMVSVIREASGGKVVGFDLNYNRSSARGRKTSDFESLFPGNEYVTSVSVSTYNRCGLDPSHMEPKSFADEFGPAYDAIVKFTDLPIWVAEVSTTNLCGVDKIDWFRDMLESLKTRFTRVTNVNFFFENVPTGKATNDKPIFWGIPENEWDEFRKLIDNFRAYYNLPTPETVTEVATFGASGMPRGTFSYPWTISGNISSTFGDTENDEVSGVTGKPYGQKETVGFLRLSQGIAMSLARLTDTDTVGLDFYVQGSLSTNPNRYWDNDGAVGVELTYCLGKPSFSTFGNSCAFVGGRVTQYLDGPDRYSNGRDESVSTGLRFNWGGYWGR